MTHVLSLIPTGWAVQAQEHSARASDLLPICTPNSTSREDRVHILNCLLNIYLTQGGATLLLAKYPLPTLFL